ncbi:capsular polysaccharide export protein, LipB/KpsS family [Psychrobacter alimentarius]|uniref:capsular polysaccharide export protein, LipB/KpsS family n=1 Tax=Psychrobacter alimentarius TaxID=261164 RepID=UPI00191A80C2|nr:hypothetical protein [Psychrobacter alimentarius]
MIKKKVSKLYKLYQKSLSTNMDIPLEFKGNNWSSEENKKLAILVGFNPWKRDIASAYLKDYRTAFLMGKVTLNKIKRLNDTFIKNIDEKEITFFIWGKKDDFFFSRYLDSLKLKGVKVNKVYVEDGFVRSINSGILHSRPASLTFDTVANHFENKENDLERLLSNYKLSQDEKDMAEFYLNVFRDLRITKYFDPNPFDNEKFNNEITSNKAILVIGQVEDDASIISSKSKIKTNHELVSLAIKENPNSKIYYRPHPDYFAEIREDKNKNNVYKLCDVLSPETSIFEILGVVEKVYTISSLAGFEAVIHGKNVTVLGTPFYSNWGLTDDRTPINRRQRKLTLEEIFYIVYIKYPKYMSMVSDEPSSLIETITYFLVETLKYKKVNELASNKLFLNAQAYKDKLDAPFKVLSYIESTNDQASANIDEFFNVIQEQNKIKYYSQISAILISSSNYDELVGYSNKCLELLEDEVLSNSSNLTLYTNFLESLCFAQSNTNGRVLNNIPSLVSLLESNKDNMSSFQPFFRFYVLSLSNNLQYDLLQEVLDWIKEADLPDLVFLSRKKDLHNVASMSDSFSVDYSLYSTFSGLLVNNRPTRSERLPNLRSNLINISSEYFLELLNRRYVTNLDSWLNQIMYYLLLEQYKSALTVFESLYDSLEKTLIKNTGNLERVLDNKIEDLNQLSIVNEYSFQSLVDSDAFLKSRISHLLSACNKLLKNGFSKEVKLFIDLIERRGIVKSDSKHYVKFVSTKLTFHKLTKDINGFIWIFEGLSEEIQKRDNIQNLLARIYRENYMFDKALNVFSELERNSKTIASKQALKDEIDKIRFCIETSKIINSVDQPKIPKGVIFLASHACFNTLAMMAPAIVELKKQGYAFINLTEGMTIPKDTGIEFVDKLSGSLSLDATQRLNYDWRIDWDNRVVESQNINYYQGFYETLSCYSRRYFVDLNFSSTLHKQFRKKLYRADESLYVANQIFSQVVSRGLPAIIMSGNTHIAPYSIFRDFSRAKNHPLLSFINCNVAYEAYFSNLGSKFANTMCVTDMTLYPTIRAPFMAREDQFNSWFERNQDNPDYINKANSLLSLNRVGSITNDKEIEIISYLEEKKKQGKKIICAFGKVPVDLNVPFDGGSAHKDMSDWITHTVQVCNKLSEEVILLIKPHPHELRPEIALDLVDSFKDLIQCELNNNVIVLGHKDINGQALAPHLDLALLYNGSSGIEMTAQGIPVMMTSHFGKYDYPVELLYPENRAHYEQFIEALDYPVPALELRKKAAFLLCYLGTEEISIINQYSKRQLTNDRIGFPKWRMDKIKDFLENGDPKMELIAERITEKARLTFPKERE